MSVDTRTAVTVDDLQAAEDHIAHLRIGLGRVLSAIDAADLLDRFRWCRPSCKTGCAPDCGCPCHADEREVDANALPVVEADHG